jgi:IS1 family transposase
MRLATRLGHGCRELHDVMMRDLHVSNIELDELWSYVGKKQKKLKPEDGPDKGDQYVFIGIDSNAKAILTYRVGKRNRETTREFVADLRERVLGNPQINSDMWQFYADAIKESFGEHVHYAQIKKYYAGEPAIDTARRYSPGWVVGVSKERVSGYPMEWQISTSYVERTNLSVRMASRRFTRLTNGFSKKLDHHCAAVALFVAHFNLCRVHETLRETPAMALGLTDHAWPVGKLVTTVLAMTGGLDHLKRYRHLGVVDGGKR